MAKEETITVPKRALKEILKHLGQVEKKLKESKRGDWNAHCGQNTS